MRTSNPALSDDIFEKARQEAERLKGHAPTSRTVSSSEVMTISGTVNKTGILLVLAAATATLSWNLTAPSLVEGTDMLSPSPVAMPILLGGSLGGLIFAFITIFKKTAAPITAPIYALLEGLALGAISAFYEARYPGIVHQAVLGTFGTLFSLLIAYRSGLIKATENFKLGVVAATGGIAILYLIDLGMSFFGKPISFIHEGSTMGIAFSVGVVIIAALNLVLDFDFIEHGEKTGAPKYMEWYSAFGLMVTIVWLYLEILRLLSKTRKK